MEEGSVLTNNRLHDDYDHELNDLFSCITNFETFFLINLHLKCNIYTQHIHFRRIYFGRIFTIFTGILLLLFFNLGPTCIIQFKTLHSL